MEMDDNKWGTPMEMGFPHILGQVESFFLKASCHWKYLRTGRKIFPESVWAQGSSNSGGLSLIFSSSLFSSSHLHIFTSAHLHICSSSQLLIFTSAHLHIFTFSHLTSHLLIFTSSHLHIFSSSHLHIFTSSHLHISAHLHIFTSSRLLIFHIFSSSHLHIFSSCPLAPLLSSSCPPLVLLPSPSFIFLFWRRGQGQCQRDGTKRNPFARNEVRSPKLR